MRDLFAKVVRSTMRKYVGKNLFALQLNSKLRNSTASVGETRQVVKAVREREAQNILQDYDLTGGL